MADEAGQPVGLFDSLKAFARILLGLAQTRLEILLNEIDEQRALLAREALLALAAAFLFGLGVVFTAIFFVILFWDTHRLLVVGLFAALFLAAAAAAYAALRAVQAGRPKAFSTTLGELAKDRESLR
ncbi:MAG: phage holin family protein [Betaproteobacteria bacterium]|nr:phage holin family protein [Betaproteobacteria bacterium]MBI2959517.1 phage holin family protein [Betaproteobacteria bacterium]